MGFFPCPTHRGMLWPQEASVLLMVSVAEVQSYREARPDPAPRPKPSITRSRSFLPFKYLTLSAAEFRLPIVVPNPAYSQFIAGESSDPREETLWLPTAPTGNSSTYPLAISSWLLGTWRSSSCIWVLSINGTVNRRKLSSFLERSTAPGSHVGGRLISARRVFRASRVESRGCTFGSSASLRLCSFSASPSTSVCLPCVN
jgi:hypothetical protein